MRGVYYPCMAKRLMNLVLAAYLAAAGGLLLGRFVAWSDGLGALTAQAISAEEWSFRASSTNGVDFIEIVTCMCPSSSADGIAAAGFALLLAGPPLAVAAWRASCRRAEWSPGQLYLAFGVHAMSWTLSAVIGQSMLLAAIFAGEIWLHWLPLLVAANVATGVPALWRWRALLAESVGWRPALLALR